MAIQAISQLVVSDYIHPSEEGEENPTVFKLRPLNGLVYMEVMNELSRNEDGSFKVAGHGLNLILKHGLIDWVNFNDENGKAIPFNTINLARVPPTILTHIANEIVRRSETGAEERKN